MNVHSRLSWTLKRLADAGDIKHSNICQWAVVPVYKKTENLQTHIIPTLYTVTLRQKM